MKKQRGKQKAKQRRNNKEKEQRRLLQDSENIEDFKEVKKYKQSVKLSRKQLKKEAWASDESDDE